MTTRKFLIYARGDHWHRLWREHGKPNASPLKRDSRTFRALRSLLVGLTVIPRSCFALVSAKLKIDAVGRVDLARRPVDEVVDRVFGNPRH